MGFGKPHSAVPHLRQNASRCHPHRRVIVRGTALNAPTKTVLYAAPFQPPCSLDFTGNRSNTSPTLLNGASNCRNSAAVIFLRTGASSCSRPTFISFDRAFSHECLL